MISIANLVRKKDDRKDDFFSSCKIVCKYLTKFKSKGCSRLILGAERAEALHICIHYKDTSCCGSKSCRSWEETLIETSRGREIRGQVVQGRGSRNSQCSRQQTQNSFKKEEMKR